MCYDYHSERIRLPGMFQIWKHQLSVHDKIFCWPVLETSFIHLGMTDISNRDYIIIIGISACCGTLEQQDLTSSELCS
ncbi:hypothetical protein RclHR1_05360008 [Rhizophagus clarus]|uniref:Uncharacterized protein n=1 Tax=Rhizophagus clarus TaxID=94130 RepID=A0A2Z6RLQ6_9GLOM|nr:hypothetical protein RclHR1_05360008 [Rhizophagus clarus]GES74962.1 hypothetical protein RCL_e20865_RclHR1_05360008 [Rhizophagus clarus]